MLEASALVVGSLTTALITLFVVAKDRHSITNKLFLGLTIGMIGWPLLTYFSLRATSPDQTLNFIRWIMLFVIVQNTFFFLLSRVFPDYRSNFLSRRRYQFAIAYAAFTALVAVSPYLFTDFKNDAPVPGPGMVFFLIHTLVFAAGGMLALILRLKKATGLRKTQLLFFVAGTILMLTAGPVGNFIIPVIFRNNELVALSPLYAIVFSALIAYAIVTQKLFDMRAAVARSVAYLMIVASMTLVYGVGLFGVINVFFGAPDQEMLRQVLSVILITPLALLFERTRRFFDRVSNRLFFRDNYDTQEILDAVGGVVVSEIDLYKLLRDTRRVLNAALKASFIEFVLIKGDKPFFEASSTKTISQQLLALGQRIDNQRPELLVVDELGPSHPLLPYFQEAEVELSLQLKTKQQTVGYIIFGSKRSGDMYSNQDKKLLQIVANELAITIQNAMRFDEIQNFNLTLQANIEDATRKLRHTNERLKALDESKDDFISMASHQLRTPLTSVKGYLSMVLEGDAGKVNATQRKMLGQAYVSSQRMVNLIADLLNVSRLKTGKFVIDASPTNLATMVNEELDQLVETAAARQITLTYKEPKSFPDLMLDETKTRQVVMNFIDNAIYYTPAGGHIQVDLEDRPTSVELKVIDDGIGVPKSEQHHLFTKFYRAGNARKARPDGTGLGLFMAKKVIMAQGGSIIFESKEGKGSTFGFLFPKNPPLKPVHLPVTKAAAEPAHD